MIGTGGRTLNKLKLGARIILGLIYVVFGANYFMRFMPLPPLPEAAQAFMGGLAGSGYFFPLLKTTEIACGALLILNSLTPLALVVLAPISLNILMFHMTLAPEGTPIGMLIVGLHAFLGVMHFGYFKPLFGRF